MAFEGLFAGLCNGIGGIGFAANKTFMHLEIAVFLEGIEVGGQVAICELQHLFKIVEADLLIYHEYAHDTQADAAIEQFIEITYWIHLIAISIKKYALFISWGL